MINSELLVEASLGLFKEKGFRLTMDELASCLHISKRTLYEQVRSKEELLKFILQYFKQKLDEYYFEIEKTKIDSIEKFEKILSYNLQETYFVFSKLDEFKNEFPKIYEDYNKLVDERWEKNFEILNNKLLYDKKMFKTMYDSIIKAMVLNEYAIEDINALSKQIIKILINGMNSTVLGKTSNKEIIDLLEKISSGILLFTLENGAKPLFLSDSFLKFYSKDEVTMKSDLLDFIDSRDKEKFADMLKNIRLTNEVNELKYRIKTQEGLKWHHIVLTKIDSLKSENLFLAIITDETNSVLNNELLKYSEERLRIAFEQTDIGIWEYDIETKNVKISQAVIDLLGIKDNMLVNVPSKDYINEKINPIYVEKYKELYIDIQNGVEEGFCIIQEKDANNDYIWTKRSYKTIFDENHNPIKAIGIIHKINYVADIKAKFEAEEKILELAKDEVLLYVKFNITKNRVEKIVNNGGMEKFSHLNEIKYDDFIQLMLENFSNEEDKKNFLNKYSYENLKKISQTSNESSHMSYRFVGINDVVKWLSYTTNFLTDPLTGDKYSFSYVRDVNEKTKLELLFDRKVEYDVTTRVYIESSARNLINFIISKQKDLNENCAMVLLEVANFDNIKVQYGLDSARKVLYYIGRILRICFNNKNIVGRVSDNQFIIFFSKVDNENELIEKISDSIAMAHDSYVSTTDEKRIANLKVSICFSKISNTHYESMYNMCLKQLENIKLNNDIDIIDNKDTFNVKKEIIFENDFISNKEIERSSLEKLKQVVNEKTYEGSINKILDIANEYYQSTRSSIFCFDETKKKFLLKYEKQVLSKRKFDDVVLTEKEIPGFFFYMVKARPILINNIEMIKKDYPIDYKFLKSQGINSIYIFPLVEKGETLGFLCISNAIDHIGEVRLLNQISTILTSEVVKDYLTLKNKDFEAKDRLTDSFNHNSFIKITSELREKQINTLGIMCLKINDLHQINLKYGTECGDEVLIGISNILKTRFNRNDVYRTEGDRFDVVSLDIDYNKFIKTVNEVKKEVFKIREDIAFICNSWSDIDFDKMYSNLNEIIEINKMSEEKNSSKKQDKILLDAKNEMKYSMKYLLDNNCFNIKLQPKVDLVTGEIIGAEALSRLVHPELGIVPPNKFISELEKEGLIGSLDLFVLEEACKTLNKWKRENKKLIPISINYSRVTLLDNKIIKETLAMINKYDIDKNYLIIEITESIGNMEQATIAEIANKFINNNIKLSIDDFGSMYSSLSVLSLIPFSEVKLDKSIVNDLVFNERGQVIVEYIISMSKKMGMKVVAEGVETELQLEMLKKKKCDFGQGYLFEKPLSILEFEEKYQKN